MKKDSADGRVLIFTRKWEKGIVAILAVGMLGWSVFWRQLEIRLYLISREALAGRSVELFLYRNL